jgi:hypothetical protein
MGSLKGRLGPDRESREHPAGEAGAGTPAAPGATERPVERNRRGLLLVIPPELRRIRPFKHLREQGETPTP